MLRVTGKIMFRESKPWAVDGKTGTAHVARVETGRARYEDVKIPDNLLAIVPETAAIPEHGIPVDWAVELRFGKVQLVGPWDVFAPSNGAPTPEKVGR